MPGYGADERALFEDDATKLYEEVCQKGQIAASDYRIAEDGELRDAFDLLVEMGLLIFDSEQDGWAPEDPTSVQSRVVSPLSQEAAKLLVGVLAVVLGVQQPRPELAPGTAVLRPGPVHLPARRRDDQQRPGPAAGRVRGGAAHRAAGGRPRPAVPRQGGAARHRAPRARRDHAHALPAQRPAQLGHPQVRRRRDRAGCRGAHPRRVLQPDDRGRPPGRGDPQPDEFGVAVVDPRAGRGGLPRRRLRALLGARPALHQPRDLAA